MGGQFVDTRSVTEELHRVSITMQATQNDVPAAKILSSPKAMRIRRAPPPDSITLGPGSSEIAGQHMCHPAAAGATVRGSSGKFRPVECSNGAREVTPRQADLRALQKLL
jgi:hypothetical protein